MKKAHEVILVIVYTALGIVLCFSTAYAFLSFGGHPSDLSAEAPQSGVTSLKTLTVMPGDLMSPLYITRVTVGSKEMVLGAPMSAKQQEAEPNLILNAKPFEASSDWIKDMTLFIKNRTNKTVASATLALRFPETGDGRTQPVWIYHIELGKLPAVAAFNGRTGKPLRLDPADKLLDLHPGQEVVVHLGDYIDRIKTYVETAMPMFYVTKVDVSVGDCAFVDGMRWAGGSYAVPDTSNRGKWIRLDSNYFPGNPRQYWPPGL